MGRSPPVQMVAGREEGMNPNIFASGLSRECSPAGSEPIPPRTRHLSAFIHKVKLQRVELSQS